MTHCTGNIITACGKETPSHLISLQDQLDFFFFFQEDFRCVFLCLQIIAKIDINLQNSCKKIDIYIQILYQMPTELGK